MFTTSEREGSTCHVLYFSSNVYFFFNYSLMATLQTDLRACSEICKKLEGSWRELSRKRNSRNNPLQMP